MSETTERPILFSAPMVRAILDGTKMQTRRILKAPHVADADVWRHVDGREWESGIYGEGGSIARGETVKCPYGAVGDRMWVRETHDILDGRPDTVLYDVAPTPEGDWTAYVSYRATDSNEELQAPAYAWRPQYDSDHVKWRPSIFMPRWASRITLEITDVRVEKLCDISWEDALAEGVRSWEESLSDGHTVVNMHDPRDAYAQLWQSINAKRAPWESNPWVWVIEFRRAQ